MTKDPKFSDEQSRIPDVTGTSIDPGFYDYQAQLRSIFPSITDKDIGEGWMRGEVKKAQDGDLLVLHPHGEEVKRGDNEIFLGIRFKKKVFKACIPDPSVIDRMVGDWDKIVEMLQRVAPSDDPRGETRQLILNWLLTNRDVDVPGKQNHTGAIMATAMVWLMYGRTSDYAM
jgi:hypothetical protein